MSQKELKLSDGPKSSWMANSDREGFLEEVTCKLWPGWQEEAGMLRARGRAFSGKQRCPAPVHTEHSPRIPSPPHLRNERPVLPPGISGWPGTRKPFNEPMCAPNTSRTTSWQSRKHGSKHIWSCLVADRVRKCDGTNVFHKIKQRLQKEKLIFLKPTKHYSAILGRN